ncbi:MULTISPECIES: TetR/AcrR family transcriptional regulator [Crossiella]|uniref:AcrR family transcriptional regulator n=1 Tax=Crossiella cryophila TaxID=43355 RepID=A0A7W7FW43_9PSEU|nr:MULTISPECIES: helix-turn-helix domain-containing protein [Crossiella]MBB4679193.1 AcrR family transcriptional regulator [Crossiella cryophila]MCK2238749.1 TetR/AcrR family transcriptional regulator [Crossiella sp. S99.2]MCK2251681.1 TetR/AcrR family transcriptional regulator [Crossiella sp. S99.1]
MTPGGQQPRRPGRPARLTREAVVAAAVAIATEEGLAGVSMRRVAERMRCSPMALYRHIKDKEELVELVRTRLPDDHSKR